MHNHNETILYVDLNKLKHNFNFFKSKLRKSTKIICVVKAYAYGHGDIRISKALEKLNIYGLWVTDFEEGVVLRKSGVHSRIIVANPGIKSYEQVLKYNLDIVIYNKTLLDLYCSKKKPVNVHIKLNTGMNRYGFNSHEITSVCEKLNSSPHLNVLSVCSHLACADKKDLKDFTLNQLKKFSSISKVFEKKINKKLLKHILNSSGVLNYSNFQMDMVRIGIGLYGSMKNENLLPISSLSSVITQTRIIEKGDFVGYGFSFCANKKMQISIVPVGYADGLNRKLSNGVGRVIINGRICKIIGKISMGTFAVDTSEVNVSEGQKIEVFGDSLSVYSIARSLNTIPYEIYSTLNRRIKRIYL